MKEIPLTQGKVALVDNADYGAVSKFKWHAEKAGRGFYATRNLQEPDGNWTYQRLHRFLLPGVPRIDHHDGDGLNNQRENLRPATHQQNTQGCRRKKIGATSSFRGVYWNKAHCKWYARIEVSGTPIYLGCFTSETDAAKAYDAAALKHFGEFASPNFNKNHEPPHFPKTMNNISPEDFVKSLPVVSTVSHDITHGDTPLPPTALLSEAERNRLQKLADAGEQPVERAPDTREETLTTFDDGSVFKFFPRPGSTTQCILVDASGKQIAIVKDENMADFLCNSANLFVLAQLKHEADGTPMKIFHKPVILEG